MPDTLTIPKEVTVDGETLYKALVDVATIRCVHFLDGSKEDNMLMALLRELGTPAGLLLGSDLTPLGKRLEADSAAAAVAWFEGLADCFREEVYADAG
jgi:hypothetical protein